MDVLSVKFIILYLSNFPLLTFFTWYDCDYFSFDLTDIIVVCVG